MIELYESLELREVLTLASTSKAFLKGAQQTSSLIFDSADRAFERYEQFEWIGGPTPVQGQLRAGGLLCAEATRSVV